METTLLNNITSKQSASDSPEQTAALIRSYEHLKAFTISYRHTGSKTFKQECMLFAVTCILESGKAIGDINLLIGLSLVDFGRITLTPSLTIDILKKNIINVPHHLWRYTAISINEMAASAHFHEHKQHIASFCVTGNNPQFFSYSTGDQHRLPFEAEHTVMPRGRPFRYRKIYVETYVLFWSGF